MPDFPAAPGVKLDWLLLSVTPLHAFSRGRGPKPSLVGSATGFFYKHHDRIHLITNRHVIVKEDADHYPDTLQVSIHRGNTDLRSLRRFDVTLYGKRKSRQWLEHPVLGNSVDVVGIDINDQIEDTDAWGYFDRSSLVEVGVQFPIGAEVVVIGHPLAFYDSVFGLPVVRTGAIASPFGIPFRGNPFLLIDANLHPGTSGSPVVTPPATWRVTDAGPQMGKFSAKLIGVNSGEYIASGTPLGLNIVWYGHLIEEVLSQDPQTSAAAPSPGRG